MGVFDWLFGKRETNRSKISQRPHPQLARTRGGALAADLARMLHPQIARESAIILNLPHIAIRFDIAKIESGDYGIACWKIFWRCADLQRLKGAMLFEGDSAATLNGKENVYCIAVQPVSHPEVLSDIRKALEVSPEYQRMAAWPRFIEPEHLSDEPLVPAGQVDSEGNVIGKTRNSRVALEKVRREPPGKSH